MKRGSRGIETPRRAQERDQLQSVRDAGQLGTGTASSPPSSRSKKWHAVVGDGRELGGGGLPKWQGWAKAAREKLNAIIEDAHFPSAAEPAKVAA